MKLIIFDCDGTLVDSEGLSNEVLAEQAALHGLQISAREALEQFRGMKLTETVATLEERLGAPLPADFIPRFRARSAEVFHSRLVSIEGAQEVVRPLADRSCVASSAPPEKIRLSLGLTGLLPYFGERIFSSYEIESWKPEPDIFLHAAHTMGARPDECVVVEDSLPGVLAGVAAGMRVVAYQPHGRDPRLPGGITCVERLIDLLPLLGAGDGSG